ncbi:anthranilate synthase component I [Bacillus sp. FJAT-45350]|uniref:anthranilate synthase component I n=1 Tax=Bacillus sp. FJAT-45350 TaxID=2011014 RepID=UPI000BB87EDD|nr:anthranilate synthase component I [Bacillus sp. FJAT-45350]
MFKTSLSTFCEDAKSYQTVPVVSHFFADTLTPIQIFQQLENEATFLLESKDEQSPWSRYSFIGLDPFLYLYEHGEGYVLETKDKQRIYEGEHFQDTFDQALAYVNVKPIDVPIPFKGGAVGYMSYDTVEKIEPVLATDEVADEGYIHFVFCETIISYDHINKEMYVVTQPRISGESTSHHEEIYQAATKKINNIVAKITTRGEEHKLFAPPTTSAEVDFSRVKSNYERSKFLSDVGKIKEYIKSGDIFQAVLSQRFEVDITVNALEIYRVLRMINPSPYLFYLKINNLEIVGSSPERLVQVQDGHIEIHPIAGTRPRGNSKEEDQQLAKELLADEKERAEHFMLVDLARNDVGRVAKYGSVKTPVLLEIGKFSHVMHIISKVTGEIANDVHPINVLGASFPAGTVSGAPKIRAMEILQEIEPTKRGIYAGAIGYLGYDGNIDSCIAIRTMVIKNKKAYVQAGAGVVADSVAENEYEETRNKAKALIKAIQVAEAMFGEKEEVTSHV